MLSDSYGSKKYKVVNHSANPKTDHNGIFDLKHISANNYI